MLPLFAVGVGILLAIWLLARGLSRADVQALVQALRMTAVVSAGVVGLMMLLTGRFGLALAIGSIALPLLSNRWGAWNRTPAGAGNGGSQTSSLNTRYLAMTLDHHSGVLSGIVREGQFAGQRLNQLDLNQLMDLLEECRREDPRSVPVLESYLDRSGPADWRHAERGHTQAGARTPPASAAMGTEEAYKVLGLEPGASADAIRRAHRQLMMKFHPDHGGSTYLAAKINQARDLLLP